VFNISQLAMRAIIVLYCPVSVSIDASDEDLSLVSFGDYGSSRS